MGWWFSIDGERPSLRPRVSEPSSLPVDPLDGAAESHVATAELPEESRAGMRVRETQGEVERRRFLTIVEICGQALSDPAPGGSGPPGTKEGADLKWEFL